MPDELDATSPAERPLVQPGDSFHTAERTVGEQDILAFAALCGDSNRLHTDAEYARTTRHGQRIAQGLLVLGILSGLTTQARPYRLLEPLVLAVTRLTCRFLRPTFIGDTIHGVVSVVERKPGRRPGTSLVTYRRQAINQRGEIVLEADFEMLLQEGSAP